MTKSASYKTKAMRQRVQHVNAGLYMAAPLFLEALIWELLEAVRLHNKSS